MFKKNKKPGRAGCPRNALSEPAGTQQSIYSKKGEREWGYGSLKTQFCLVFFARG